MNIFIILLNNAIIFKFMIMSHLLDQHKRHRKLTTLVENRTTYNADFAELNIYETHQYAEKVALNFGFPIIASMLTSKKITTDASKNKKSGLKILL